MYAEGAAYAVLSVKRDFVLTVYSLFIKDIKVASFEALAAGDTFIGVELNYVRGLGPEADAPSLFLTPEEVTAVIAAVTDAVAAHCMDESCLVCFSDDVLGFFPCDLLGDPSGKVAVGACGKADTGMGWQSAVTA